MSVNPLPPRSLVVLGTKDFLGMTTHRTMQLTQEQVEKLEALSIATGTKATIKRALERFLDTILGTHMVEAQFALLKYLDKTRPPAVREACFKLLQRHAPSITREALEHLVVKAPTRPHPEPVVPSAVTLRGAETTATGLAAEPATTGLAAEPATTGLAAETATTGLAAEPATTGLAAETATTGLVAAAVATGLVAVAKGRATGQPSSWLDGLREANYVFGTQLFEAQEQGKTRDKATDKTTDKANDEGEATRPEVRQVARRFIYSLKLPQQFKMLLAVAGKEAVTDLAAAAAKANPRLARAAHAKVTNTFTLSKVQRMPGTPEEVTVRVCSESRMPPLRYHIPTLNDACLYTRFTATYTLTGNAVTCGEVEFHGDSQELVDITLNSKLA